MLSRHRFTRVLLFSLCVAGGALPAGTGAGAGPSSPRGLTWTAVSIPTRDGKALAADVHTFDGATPVPRPVILIQTPYNKNFYRAMAGFPPQSGGMFPLSADYHYVVLDWRGFYGSSAAAVPGYDRGLDGYDAVEWVAAQPWCDGRVGTWGSSALGYIQFQTARHRPPHLVCCVPRVKDFLFKYSDYYFGGDYRKEHVESLEKLGLTDAGFILAHPMRDAFWALMEANSDMAAEIAVPCYVIGGWFDHFPDDVLRCFRDLREGSAAPAREQHRLLFGPWLHGEVDRAEQGILTFPAAAGVAEAKTVRFWDYHLRNVANGWVAEPPVTFYQVGADAWVAGESWSDRARVETALYLQPGGTLTGSPPPSDGAPERFTYDPADPTPALGGSRFDPFAPDLPVGPQDLGPVESRPDVRTWSTPSLAVPLRINGSVKAGLFFSSDRTDTDLCVRLTDVHPDGRSIILAQGIRRLRFRDGFTAEHLMAPGAVYEVEVTLQDLALTVLPGHRLRIAVCSADYPHFDLNRNDGGPLYVAGPAWPAVNTVYQDAARPSRLRVSQPHPGDVDGDGRRTAADLVLLSAFLAGNVPDLPPGGSGGDADGDGRVTAADLAAILH
ncbi:MAG: CocE/NonD family hydrolase [Acidobacteria bacterium]|nr:CocE/NonD family hydrolase [Acidobacteriota bacterium]